MRGIDQVMNDRIWMRVPEKARNSKNVGAIPTRITRGASLDRTSARTGVRNRTDSQSVYVRDLAVVWVRVPEKACILGCGLPRRTNPTRG